MTPMVHVSNSIKLGAEENCSPHRSPKKRIESADKAVEDPTMQQAVSWSQSKKISEEANEELQSFLAKDRKRS